MNSHPSSLLLRIRQLALLAIAFGMTGASVARSDSADPFYKSNKLTIGVPNGPGGGYDIYVRTLSRHISQHIPGHPSIVVQNVPAAGGMVLTNMLYNSAPKDGTYIAMVRGSTVQEQTYKNPQVQFDGRKFAWIGSMNSDYMTCIVWAASGIKTIGELYQREIAVGASGVGADSYSHPAVFRELLGMKLKVIAGYPGTPERILAMERGELTGACGVSTSSLSSALAPYLASEKIRVITQAGIHKDRRYPDVPSVLDEAKDTETRQALEFFFLPLAIGRSIAAPPGTAQERAQILRNATELTLEDPEFLKDAKKVGIDIEPLNADQTTAVVEQLLATPPAVVARIQRALSHSQ